MEAWVPRLKSPRKFYLGDRLLSLGTPAKTKKFSLERSPAPPSYWKCDTLHAFVERGSAFIEDISTESRKPNFCELPYTLNIYGGNIDVRFVLISKGTLVWLVYLTEHLSLSRTHLHLHTFQCYST